jgi:hypothetical protein
MSIPCKHCCQSGNYIDFCGYSMFSNSSGIINTPFKLVPCKYCKGIGWIDDEELITVPRKFIKDEYFKNLIY